MAESSTGQPHLNLVIQLGGMQLGSHVPIWPLRQVSKTLPNLIKEQDPPKKGRKVQKERNNV
jgi:hypothetical protein